MVILRRLLVIFAFLLAGKNLVAQYCDTSLWIPNGPVHALQLRDSLLFVGGEFTQVSPATGHFVRLDSTTANLAPPFPQIYGRVNCMAKDSIGRVYVGGSFSQVGSLNIRNLFRFDSLGQIDLNFIPDPDGEVFTVAVYNNVLWIGGDFLSVSGFPRGRGAAIAVQDSIQYRDAFGVIDSVAYFSSTDTLTAFNPGANGPIYAIYPDQLLPVVFAGGDFSFIGGFPVTYVAKLKASDGLCVPTNNSFWQATPNLNGPVRAIRIWKGDVYLAGEFDHLGTYARHGLATVDFSNGAMFTLDQNQQPAYNAGSNGAVYDMEVVNDQLYVVGDFTILGGNIRNRTACLDSAFRLLTWTVPFDGVVKCIERWGDSTFVFGGNFTVVNGDTIYNAAIAGMDTVIDVHAWNPMFDGEVLAVMPSQVPGSVYAGGEFTGANGVARKNLCVINTNTRRPDGWRPDLNDVVYTLYADNTHLYVAGDFTSVNGQNRTRLASFRLADYSLSPFNPGVNGLVRTMTSRNSLLYIGGNFTVAGGQQRSSLACIDTTNSQATVWNPNVAGTVNKIIADNHHLYVGGFFPQAGAQSRNNLARIDLTTGLADWNWQCDADDGIYDMELYNGTLYFGGWFLDAGGQSRAHLAAADTLTGAVASFNPGVDDYVRCFTRWNDDLFFSGPFINTTSSLYRPRMANFDLGDGAFDTWSPQPSSMAESMQCSQDWLYCGGGFTFIGGKYHPNLAMVSVNYVTGIPATSNGFVPSVTIWPNPATDVVNVVLPAPDENGTIEITDATGRIVYQKEVQPGNENMVQLDVSALAEGIYQLTIRNGGIVSGTAKLVR